MIIAGFALLFIGVMLVICYPINKRKNARCSAQTQGVLKEIRARYNSSGSIKDMHVYSYQVDGIEHRLKTLDHSQQVSKVGDSCTIWYNPRRPKDAQAFRGSDQYLRILLIIGIVLTLLGIVLFLFGLV